MFSNFYCKVQQFLLINETYIKEDTIYGVFFQHYNLAKFTLLTRIVKIILP